MALGEIVRTETVIMSAGMAILPPINRHALREYSPTKHSTGYGGRVFCQEAEHIKPCPYIWVRLRDRRILPDLLSQNAIKC